VPASTFDSGCIAWRRQSDHPPAWLYPGGRDTSIYSPGRACGADVPGHSCRGDGMNNRRQRASCGNISRGGRLHTYSGMDVQTGTGRGRAAKTSCRCHYYLYKGGENAAHGRRLTALSMCGATTYRRVKRAGGAIGSCRHCNSTLAVSTSRAHAYWRYPLLTPASTPALRGHATFSPGIL